jgi:hypothetical protein
METTTFAALAERAGRWWTVRVPQIEGLAVQVRSLDQAEMMARRHIAEALHVPPESVRVEVHTETSVLPAVTKALQARQAAIQAAEAAARATHAAIEALLADGSTLQDAIIVLKLSPEEVAGFVPGTHSATGASGASGSPGAPSSPGTSGSAGTSGSNGASAGLRASHGHGEVGRPVGPAGLPQRTRSTGPTAVHH